MPTSPKWEEVLAEGPECYVGTDIAGKCYFKMFKGNYICKVKDEQKARKR